MSCIYKRYDQGGGYCLRTHSMCNCEAGCPDRTDSEPSYNSTTNEWEQFIDCKLTAVHTDRLVKTDSASANPNPLKYSDHKKYDRRIDRIYTVGDLKEFLRRIPDDAFVYEQIKPDGKELQAIEANWTYGKDNCTKTCKAWDFPDFVILPLSSQDTMEQLTEIYDRHHSEK